MTSPQAFEGLRNAGRKVRRPDCTLATVDHNVPTDDRTDFKEVRIDPLLFGSMCSAKCEAKKPVV